MTEERLPEPGRLQTEIDPTGEMGRLLFEDTPAAIQDWVEAFLSVANELGQVVPFKLFPQQRKILEDETGRDIIVKGRQTRASTILLARNLRPLVTGQVWGANCVVGAQDDSTTALFRKKIQHWVYNDLAQKGFKLDVIDNEREFVFKDFGNRILWVSGEQRTMSRGFAAQMVLFSEFAHWKDTALELLGGALPAIPAYPFGRIVLESTPKGEQGAFYKYASEAKGMTSNPANALWSVHLYPWWLEPRYQAADDPTLGRDIVLSVPELQYRRLYLDLTEQETKLQAANKLIPEQIIWRRLKKEEQDRTNAPFLQEFPEDLDTCIALGQRVGTSEGILPIEDVPVNTGSDHGTVRGWADKGVRETVYVETSQGYGVRCTLDHRIACVDGSFVEAGESRGALIRLEPPMLAQSLYTARWEGFAHTECSLTIDEDWGRLLGYYMGDGSYYNTTLSFACDARDTDVAVDIAGLVQTTLGVAPTTTPVRNGCVSVNVTRKALSPLFQALGLLSKEFAYSKRHVCVPEVIWRSPKSVIVQFLRGLFEADGHISANGRAVRFFSKHNDFARDVQLLLLALGITCKLSHLIKKVGDRTYDGFELGLSVKQTEAFLALIGFVSQRKRARGLIPPPAGNNGRTPRPNIMEDTITITTPTGLALVYDLQITGTAPLFSANGILVHNCWMGVQGKFFDTPDGVDHLEYYRDGRKPPVKLYEKLPYKGADVPFYGHNFAVWEFPDQADTYVIGFDTAGGGMGSDADYSVAYVASARKEKVVARLRVQTSPKTFAAMIAAAGAFYNTATVNGEADARGRMVFEELRDLAYRNVHYHVDPMKPLKNQVLEPGMFPTEQNRQNILEKLKVAVTNHAIEVFCPELVREMNVFTWVKYQNRLRAMADKAGQHDDCIFAVAYCWWIIDKVRNRLKRDTEFPEEIVVNGMGLVVSRGPANGEMADRDKIWLGG